MKNVKKKVINVLKGKLEVTKITKKIDDEEIKIIGDFLFNGKIGRFEYSLGNDEGLDNVNFDDEEGEDIEDEIYNWVEKHVEWTTIIKVDGKEI